MAEQVAPETTTPAEHAVAQAAQDESAFDILEYQIEGNTVLPALAIEEAVYPFLGEKKSVKDVEQARQALEKRYHEAGYLTVLVDTPEQEVKSGLVRLIVTEAKVARLKVSGSHYYSLGWIKQQAPSLAEGSVPYFPDVQQDLTKLARAQDRQVVPVLRAGNTPGTVEVELQVKDQFPLHGSVELNNRYGANTTHSRMSASLRYDNLCSVSTVCPSAIGGAGKSGESNVLSGTYVIPARTAGLCPVRRAFPPMWRRWVGSRHWARAITTAYAGSSPCARGMSTTITRSPWARIIRIHSERGGQRRYHRHPIRYAPLMAQYATTLRWEKAFTQFDIAANFHLRGARKNDTEFAAKRYKASPIISICATACSIPSRFGIGASTPRQVARPPVAP